MPPAQEGRRFSGCCHQPSHPSPSTVRAMVPTRPRCCAPHRALQHTNLLQCLAQCAEVTPYLLVMEFCPLVSPCGPVPLVSPGVLGTAEPPQPSAAEGDSGTARRVT